MTLYDISTTELIDHLKEHGFEHKSDEYMEVDRIVYMKDGESFILNFTKRYNYLAVVKLCEQFDIPAHKECQKIYDQHVVLAQASKKDPDKS